MGAGSGGGSKKIIQLDFGVSAGTHDNLKKELSAVMDSLNKDGLFKIDFKVDENALKRIKETIAELNNAQGNTGKGAGSGFAITAKAADDARVRLNKLQLQLDGLSGGSRTAEDAITRASAALQKFSAASTATEKTGAMQEYTQAANDAKIAIDTVAAAEKKAAVATRQREAAGRSANKEALAAARTSAQDNTWATKATVQVDNLANSYKRLGFSEEAAAAKVAELRASLASFSSATKETDKVAAKSDFSAGIIKATQAQRGLSQAVFDSERAYRRVINMQLQMTNILSQSQNYYQKYNQGIVGNGALDDKWQTFMRKLDEPGNFRYTTQARLEMNLLKQESRAAGVEINTLSEKFSNLFSQHLSTAVVMYGIMLLRRGLSDLWTNISEIDGALTQLKIVSHATGEEIAETGAKAAEAAHKIGVSVKDILASVETYARLGYSLNESLNLAEITNAFANIAAIDVDSATSGFTAILKAFQFDPSEVEHIGDVLTDVGANYAVSAEELAAALERGGAALEAGGNTFEEAVAIITAGNAAVQNAEAVGTAMKTLSMRVRGSTTELQEMGEDVDDVVKSTSKMRDEIMGLTGVDIMLDPDTYKSTYQILVEISKVWDSLSDIQQASTLENLAGKRQASVVKSVITNFEDLQNSYQTAVNSTGALERAQATYLDSIEGRMGQVSSSFQQLSADLISSEFFKVGIQGVDIFTRFLGLLAKANLLLPSVAAGLGLLFGAKKFASASSVVRAFASEITLINSSTSKAGASMVQYGSALANMEPKMWGAAMAQAGLTSEQQKGAVAVAQKILSGELLKKQTLENIITTSSLSDEERLAALAAVDSAFQNRNLANSNYLVGTSTKDLTNTKLYGLLVAKGVSKEKAEAIVQSILYASTLNNEKKEHIGLAAAMKMTWATNKIGVIMMAVTALISLISYIQMAADSLETLDERIDNNKEAWEESKSAVEDVNSELEKAISRMRELENISAPTFVEQHELDKLRESVGLLTAEKKAREAVSKLAENELVESLDKKARQWSPSWRTPDNKEYMYWGAGSPAEITRPYFNDSTLAETSMDASYGEIIAETAEYYKLLVNRQKRGYELTAKEKNDLKGVEASFSASLQELTELMAQYPSTSRTSGGYKSLYENYITMLGAIDPAAARGVGLASLFSDKQYDGIEQQLKKLGEAGELTGEKLREIYETEGQTNFTSFIEEFVSRFGAGGRLTDELDSLAVAYLNLTGAASSATGSQKETEEVLVSISDTYDGVLDNAKKYSDAWKKLQKGELEYTEVLDLIKEDTSLGEGLDRADEKFGKFGDNLKNKVTTSLDEANESLKNLFWTQRDAGDSAADATYGAWQMLRQYSATLFDTEEVAKEWDATPFESDKAAVEHKLNMGELDTSGYLDEMVRLQEAYLAVENEADKDYVSAQRDMAEKIYELREKLAEESSDAIVDSFQNWQEKQKYYLNVGLISEEQYYADLADKYKEYFVKYEDESIAVDESIRDKQRSVREELYDYEQKLLEEAEKGEDETAKAEEGKRDEYEKTIKVIEHTIKMLEDSADAAAATPEALKDAVAATEAELERVKAAGLSTEDEYVMQLEEDLKDFNDRLQDEYEKTAEAVRDGIESMYEGLFDGLERELGSAERRDGAWEEQVAIAERGCEAIIQQYKDLKAAGVEITDDMLDEMEDRYLKWVDTVKDANLKILESQKEVMDEFVSAITNQLDDEIEALNKVSEAESEAYDKQIDALNDAKDAYDEEIDSQIDALEETQDALEKSIESQIDSLNSAQEAYEEDLDTQIEAINAAIEESNKKYEAQIELLREAKEQRDEEAERAEKLLDIEEKLDALRNKQKQKTLWVYREGRGFDWEVDETAIAEAQKAYDDARTEYDRWEENLATEKQIKLLEEAKQAAEERYKAEIDALEQLKEESKKQTDAQVENLETQKKASQESMEAQKKNLEDMKEAYAENISSQIKTLEESRDALKEYRDGQVEQLESLKQAWSDALNIQSDAQKYAAQLLALSGFENASYEERLNMLASFVDSYNSLLAQMGSVESWAANASLLGSRSIVPQDAMSRLKANGAWNAASATNENTAAINRSTLKEDFLAGILGKNNSTVLKINTAASVNSSALEDNTLSVDAGAAMTANNTQALTQNYLAALGLSDSLTNLGTSFAESLLSFNTNMDEAFVKLTESMQSMVAGEGGSESEDYEEMASAYMRQYGVTYNPLTQKGTFETIDPFTGVDYMFADGANIAGTDAYKRKQEVKDIWNRYNNGTATDDEIAAIKAYQEYQLGAETASNNSLADYLMYTQRGDYWAQPVTTHQLFTAGRESGGASEEALRYLECLEEITARKFEMIKAIDATEERQRYNSGEMGIDDFLAWRNAFQQKWEDDIRAKYGYYAGTPFASRGLAEVDELGTEFVVKNRGRYTYLEYGDKVIPAKPSKELIDLVTNPSGFLKRNGGMPIKTPGLPIKPPVSTFSTGDIYLSGVQNVDEFAKAIKTRFGAVLQRELMK